MRKPFTNKMTVLDFFAGIGLVRYALERRGWKEIYALDYSNLKYKMYTHHFGESTYAIENVHEVDPSRVPYAALAHASFPCTDTSVAGSRLGLAGPESSAFWGFIRVLTEMGDNRPPLVLLENVEGFLTSNKGEDLRNALKALNQLDYSVDILLIDAAHFVPQSRVRLFIIGVKGLIAQNMLEQEVILNQQSKARPNKIKNFIRNQFDIRWYLIHLPELPERYANLEMIIDHNELWWKDERSQYLFNQMHNHHKSKILYLMSQEKWTYGTAFRRMRIRDGVKQSTAEIRLDGIAGCLRTPKGGSARQIVIRAGFNRFDARLLNAIENARLMGADEYQISPDQSLNDVLFGFGDAVCVPVIEWISQYSIEPLYAKISKIEIM